MQRWQIVQHELIPELKNEAGALTPKLERVIHTLEWGRIQEFVKGGGCGVGRPPHERAWLANAFVAKAVLGLTTTAALIERLSIDRALRRICGFSLWKKLPSEATFSRAFDGFSSAKLAERVHEAFVQAHLGEQLIGHLSRDTTAIEVRERPDPKKQVCAKAAPGSPVARQRRQTLSQMLPEIPTACDRGSKCNAQGYKASWNGYKLHLDTADCGVPISALLSSASMHDSRVAIPLSLSAHNASPASTT